MNMYYIWGTEDLTLFKQASVEYGNHIWHNLLAAVIIRFTRETFLMALSYYFCFYHSLYAGNLIETDILSENFLTSVGNTTE